MAPFGPPGGIFREPVPMCLNSGGGGIEVGAPGLFIIADGVNGIRNGGAGGSGGSRIVNGS